MNIMELGAIGELIGGVAVLVTLLYLAMQVRQGNALEMAESHRSAIAEFNSVALGVDREELMLFRRASNQFDALTKDDQLVFHAHMSRLLLLGHQTFFLAKRGVVDEVLASTMDKMIVSTLGQTGTQQWWRCVEQSGLYEAEYIDHLQALVNAEDRTLPDYFPWYGPDAPGEA